VSTPDTPDRPLRRDAERNRRRILSAARELFAVRGLEASLNDVAHHAGVGVGTVYRRFPTKEALLEAIFEDVLNDLTALAESALRQPDSWDAFTWFVQRQCEMAATDRGLREIAFGRSHGGARLRAARARLRGVTTRLVERAQRDGHLRPGVATTDMPVLALIAGTVAEHAGPIGPDLWRRYVELLIDGMRHLPGRPPVAEPALTTEALDRVMSLPPRCAPVPREQT